jgi:hypothetical protein
MRITIVVVGMMIVAALIITPTVPQQAQSAAGPYTLYLPLIYKNWQVPTPTPTPTPCNTSTQALNNPSFEQPLGNTNWIITDGNPYRSTNAAHSGLYSLHLGGYTITNGLDGVSQTVNVPSWAQNAALYFSWLMYSTYSSVPRDTLYVDAYVAPWSGYYIH